MVGAAGWGGTDIGQAGDRALAGPVTSVRACSVLLLTSVLMLGASVGCVPYQRFSEAEHKLHTQLGINRDLVLQLKEAESLLAQKGAGSSIANASYNELMARHDRCMSERDALERANQELIARLSNLPDLVIDAGSGFDRSDAEALDAQLGERGELILEGDVLFPSGRATLRAEVLRKLDQLASLVRDKYPDRVLLIHGHTDVDPIEKSKWRDNWDLAMNRAHAVFAHMKKQGVREDQMRLYAAGYSEPAGGVQDTSAKEGKARCRRVEVYLGRVQSR